MKPNNDKITKARLDQLLSYDPATGVFTWRHRVPPDRKTQFDGKVAGKITARGYVIIKIDQKYHYAHRLAWLTTHGEFPERLIDHRNGVRSENWILNLREATHCQNSHNSGARNPTSGHKGVMWSRQTNSWRVRIRYGDGKSFERRFDDLEFAVLVADAAREKFHGVFANHG